MKISIILVNYNGIKVNQECILSLLKQPYNNIDIDIILVDNASEDNSAYMVKDIFQNKVKVIFLKENVGFAAANNQGIKFAIKNNADYIILLNNDTEVEKDFFIQIEKAIMNHQNAVITPLILNKFNQNIWFAGGYVDLIKGNTVHLTDAKRASIEREVDFATGCCLIASAEKWKEILPMSEEYFLYFEDADLCEVIHKHNIEIWYCPSIKLYHKVSSSTGGSENPLFLYYFTRNRLFYMKKWHRRSFKIFFIYFVIVSIMKEFKWWYQGEKELLLYYQKAIQDFKGSVIGKVSYSFRDNE